MNLSPQTNELLLLDYIFKLAVLLGGGGILWKLFGMSAKLGAMCLKVDTMWHFFVNDLEHKELEKRLERAKRNALQK